MKKLVWVLILTFDLFIILLFVGSYKVQKWEVNLLYTVLQKIED